MYCGRVGVVEQTAARLSRRVSRRPMWGVSLGAIVVSLTAHSPANASSFSFTAGDLVIDTVTGTTLDTASPMTLQQFGLSSNGSVATQAGSMTLPQATNGANSAISGEYGSASEGFLTQSVNGAYLTVMGYGVNAVTFNSAPTSQFGNSALGQTTSLTASQQTGGTIYQTVPRVVALIGANGGVNTSTALTGVFNTNNPRSAVTVDGTSFYVSGQGASKTDPTQGVLQANLGATTATTIDNSTDTRALAIYNNSLYVSRDFNPPGSGGQNSTNVSTYNGLPNTTTTSTRVIPSVASVNGGNTSSIDLTAALANGVNNGRIGSFVYLSPEQYFFANSTTLYVADSGQPKNGNVNKAALGEGGLQKWTLNTSTGNWTLDYDLVSGLSLVNNAGANSNTPTAPGVTGLFGLTGEVVGNEVELFATSYGLNELSPSYLYEITDSLGCTDSPNTANSCSSGETFSTLYAAPADVSIRGVAFAPTGDLPLTPTPLPSTWALMLLGLFGFGVLGHRRSARSNTLVVGA